MLLDTQQLSGSERSSHILSTSRHAPADTHHSGAQLAAGTNCVSVSRRRAAKQQAGQLASQGEALQALERERDAQTVQLAGLQQLQVANARLQEQLAAEAARRVTMEDGSASRGPTDDVSSQPPEAAQVGATASVVQSRCKSNKVPVAVSSVGSPCMASPDIGLRCRSCAVPARKAAAILPHATAGTCRLPTQHELLAPHG